MEACRAQGAHLAHIADNLPLRLPGGPPPDASALPSSSFAATQVREATATANMGHITSCQVTPSSANCLCRRSLFARGRWFPTAMHVSL